MDYLHSKMFLHKDLAARNILIHDKTAKIADLGLCSAIAPGGDEDYTVRKIFKTFFSFLFSQ